MSIHGDGEGRSVRGGDYELQLVWGEDYGGVLTAFKHTDNMDVLLVFASGPQPTL